MMHRKLRDRIRYLYDKVRGGSKVRNAAARPIWQYEGRKISMRLGKSV